MRKLSDKQWSIIEPLLPRQDFTIGGRPRKDDRQIFEAIRWILT
ncbi:IS5/IS1182 family transposase, partial [Candidatus Roizmanbacteria bacterium CG_4_10_14_0_2_um_filter_39_12]